jgi:hypothetical protein
LILLAAMALAAGACGQATTTDPSAPSDGPGQTDAVESSSPTDAQSESPTETPGPSTPGPTATTASGSPDVSPVDPGSASACSGSDENRDFFASMAAAVDWTVYCPVLPDGWFVNDGQYRLANGGWMEITYDGPDGSTLDLRQGALGDAGDGCVPPGSQIGDAAFGDQAGVLIGASAGGYAIVVDRGETTCWMILVAGVDESGARSIGADLRAVAG